MSAERPDQMTRDESMQVCIQTNQELSEYKGLIGEANNCEMEGWLTDTIEPKDEGSFIGYIKRLFPNIDTHGIDFFIRDSEEGELTRIKSDFPLEPGSMVSYRIEKGKKPEIRVTKPSNGEGEIIEKSIQPQENPLLIKQKVIPNPVAKPIIPSVEQKRSLESKQPKEFMVNRTQTLAEFLSEKGVDPKLDVFEMSRSGHADFMIKPLDKITLKPGAKLFLKIKVNGDKQLMIDFNHKKLTAPVPLIKLDDSNKKRRVETTLSPNTYIVKEGNNLYDIVRNELGLNMHPDNLTKKIREKSLNGETKTTYTTRDYSNIEIGDSVSLENGELIIERTSIRKFDYLSTHAEETLESIMRDVFRMNFSAEEFDAISKILLIEGEDAKKQKRPFDGLKPWDTVTLKYVNKKWQYIIDRFYETSETSENLPINGSVSEEKIPDLKSESKNTPSASLEEIAKPIAIAKKEPTSEVLGGRKDPLESTYSYAEGLITGLPSGQKKRFLDLLESRLESLDRTQYDTIGELDAACTKIRVTLGREIFQTLTAKEFESFHRNAGGSNRLVGKKLVRILGKNMGEVTALGHNPITIKEGIELKYGANIKSAAIENGLSYDFLRSIIQQESKGDLFAISKSGALSLGQHLKGVWMRDLSYEGGLFPYEKSINPVDPVSNINRTASYLNKILKYLEPHFKNTGVKDMETKLLAASSAYNGGPNRIRLLVKAYGSDYLSRLKKRDNKDAIDPGYAKKVIKIMNLSNQNLLAQK